MKSIKEEYKTNLQVFLGFHIVLIYILIFGLSNLQKLHEVELYKSAFLFILPILSIILNGIMPNSLKEFFVFWRFKERLPGFKAFSKYGIQDARIDMNRLKAKYPEINTKLFDENVLWYKIYQKHQKAPSVWDAQKNYLFTRDMTTLSIYFIAISLFIEFYLAIDLKSLYLFFLIEYFVLVLSCRNYSVKFVTNVLALESCLRIRYK